jgi:photosystem II stability/assembly factor-like uncharacterized protein
MCAVVCCAALVHLARADEWQVVLPDGSEPISAFSHTEKGGFYILTSTKMWKSRDDGRTWATSPVRALSGLDRIAPGPYKACIAAQDPDIVYAVVLYRLYRSDSGGRVWSPLPSPLAGVNQVVDPSSVTGLAVSPVDPHRIFATTGGLRGGDVFLSANGGMTWANISKDMEGLRGTYNSPRIHFVHPDSGRAYVEYGLATVTVRLAEADATRRTWKLLAASFGGPALGFSSSLPERALTDAGGAAGQPYALEVARLRNVAAQHGLSPLLSFAYHAPSSVMYGAFRLAAGKEPRTTHIVAVGEDGSTQHEELSYTEDLARVRPQLFFLAGSNYLYMQGVGTLYRAPMGARVYPTGLDITTWSTTKAAR